MKSVLLFLCLAISACTSTPRVSPSIMADEKTPHPMTFDFVALKLLFQAPNAPRAALGEFADRCDEDFAEKGAARLVSEDAERMHWCFYAKLARLHESLHDDTRWNVRQKKMKVAFEFLSPVANAFSTLKNDSRYLRWEQQYYNKTSEWVFFKKIDRKSNRAPASVPTPSR